MTSPVQLDTPTDARSLAFQAANARNLETVATNDDYRDYYREDDPPAAPPGSDRPVRTEMPPKSRRILDRVRLAVGNPRHPAHKRYLEELKAKDAEGTTGAVKAYQSMKLSAMAAGVDRDTIKAGGRVLSQIIKPGTDPRAVRRRERWEELEWERGLRTLDPTEWLAQTADIAARTDWSGRTGPANRAVFEYTARQAARNVERTCWAGKRQTSEDLDISDQTVLNAWGRLAERGLLIPVYSTKIIGCEQTPDGPKDRYAIAGHRVNLPPTSADAQITPPSSTSSARVFSGVISSTDLHSIYGVKGIGARGRWTLQLLRQGAIACDTETAAELGYSCVRSLRRHLQKFVTLSLATTADGRTYQLVAGIEMAKDAAAEASGAAHAHRERRRHNNYARKWWRYPAWLQEQIAKKFAPQIGRNGNPTVYECCDMETEYYQPLQQWRDPGESRWGQPRRFREAVDNGLMAA